MPDSRAFCARFSPGPGMALLAALLAGGCVHGAGQGPPLSDAARRFVTEAEHLPPVAFEEDFVEARLVYQALPLVSPHRYQLRARLIDYLLRPLSHVDAEKLRKDPSDLGNAEDLERVLDALRDALDLFAPGDLWDPAGLRLTTEERDRLANVAHLVVSIYASQGNETAAATGLFVLAALNPNEVEWRRRLDELFGWVNMSAEMAPGSPSPVTPPTAIEILETVVSTWPTPAVADRLMAAYQTRQDRLASVLRQPLGTTRPGLGALLMEGETLQSMALNVAALYLRCGQINRAAEVLRPLAGRPGDNPDLRQLVNAAATRGAKPEAFAALARRFLPHIDVLGGTSSDRLEPPVAHQVLRAGLQAYPENIDLLVLASRVARFIPAPYLSIRYLEEAQTVLARVKGPTNLQGDVAAELAEVSFARLRVRMDPERVEPISEEAERLRRRLAANRQRFGDGHAKIHDSDIDFELGRSFMDAGQLDRAETLLQRVRSQSSGNVEVTLQLATLEMRRGQPGQAITLLRDTLQAVVSNSPSEETVGAVESQAKLARSLGLAYEAAGNLDQARQAWRLAAQGWERLMMEYLHRKIAAAAAEATFEVGRLYYLLGKHEEGTRKFLQAIEQNESRDQGYIDALSFLVQRGEVDAALDIYRRALARSSRVVSEYVKIYSSFWILDLTRRSGRPPEASAEAYLRSVDSRKIQLRPPRAAAWYLPLVRFVIGRITYDQLASLANTTGRRAELYFYQAMRRLEEGRSDDAHVLWNKVIETNMVSFFEFEMAARYLRLGAPSQSHPEGTSGEAI